MKTYAEELLILTKTYPGPSSKHRETTCVAALNRRGELRRVFPVPFRFLNGTQQFQKWEWIRANLIRAASDKRPESYKIDVDTSVQEKKLARVMAGKKDADGSSHTLSRDLPRLNCGDNQLERHSVSFARAA